MRSKQILDAFSETLMQDERILSPRERELLTGILQHSKTISRSTPELQSAVAAAIGRSVGETVAQRAFALLGSNIVEQIMVCSGVSARATETVASDAADLAPPIPLSGHQSPVPPAGPASSPLGPRPPAPSPVPPGGPELSSSPQEHPRLAGKVYRRSKGCNEARGTLAALEFWRGPHEFKRNALFWMSFWRRKS